MERTYKNTDEIMDYLKVVPVFDSSGLRLDVYLDGRKVGRIDEHTKEIALDVKVAEKENSNVNRTDSLDSYWEYSQSTGQLTHVDNQTGERTPAGTGYSGNGVGLNTPNMQSKPFVALPIPQGTYDIGSATTTKGPLTLPLTPRQSTDTFGRDQFRIHGDNSCGCQSASKGCIILRRSIREQINNSEDRILRVVP
ncbi:MAG TPA: tlde1 domain-containing protein [Candidatus Wunengus sp. YC65]|uniref:tlde1 domain-containing protein n=1 Tax=Candidatus Wunengus sp. YC65 TaxID=3367701 RepID=UPI0040272678